MKKKLIQNSFGLSVILALLMFSAAFYSCEPQEEAFLDETATQEQFKNDPLYKHIQSLGFDMETVKDEGDHYAVEEDVMFFKEDYKHLNEIGTEQASTNALVRGGERNITIRIDGSMPTSGTDNWRNEIRQAINDWNSIRCSRVKFRLVNGAAAITIRSDGGALGNNVLAAATFPSRGRVGNLIRVNLDFFNNRNMSTGQKRYTMVHEIGHCIGFRHTNWQGEGSGSVGANLIPGTPASDGRSVMQGGTALNSWAGFSRYDIVGTQHIYPSGTSGCPAPFFRYFGNTDHFYTTDFAEVGSGRNGYRFESIQCRIFISRVGGTVPLYRYFNRGRRDHLYTTNFSEFGNGRDGYAYEGIAGYVYPSAGGGRSPLYRYYNSSMGNHFYTTNFNELGNGGNGWVREGITGYVLRP